MIPLLVMGSKCQLRDGAMNTKLRFSLRINDQFHTDCNRKFCVIF